MNQPLVVSCGVGRDSVAMLIGMWQRDIRPDLILFADVGAERQATYDYIPLLNDWLATVGFPQLTIVRYQVKDFKHWPHYFSLEENLLTNACLASVSYGYHDCSSKWKLVPQHNYVKRWQPALDAWVAGLKVRKAIGFDASPHERKRSKGCGTYAVKEEETKLYDLWFPLQEWSWDLARCIREIEGVGMPVPTKSSCYFCLAVKPWELDQLDEARLKRIIVIEARAKPRLKTVEGIWRKRIKGMRGATPRPGSMTEYIREKGLLPSEEINRLITATPTRHLHRGEITNWQDWLKEICYPQPKEIAA